MPPSWRIILLQDLLAFIFNPYNFRIYDGCFVAFLTTESILICNFDLFSKYFRENVAYRDRTSVINHFHSLAQCSNHSTTSVYKLHILHNVFEKNFSTRRYYRRESCSTIYVLRLSFFGYYDDSIGDSNTISMKLSSS